MNKRIQEIASECGIIFEATKQNRVHSVSTETLQKFADSIIKECVNITIDLNRGDVGGGLLEYFESKND